MKQVDISNVQAAGESRRLQAGGYVCQITKVEDFADREYLRIEFDVADGDFKGYYKDLNDSAGFWAGRYIRSYKPKALPFFKRFCSAVSKSNGNYVFDGGQINSNEQTLVGKYVGLVLGEEEYIGNDGNIKTRLYVVGEHSTSDINNGKFRIPPLKKLPDEDIPLNQPEIKETDTSDLPF